MLHNIHTAVVGAGFIGPVHVEALRRLGVTITGIMVKIQGQAMIQNQAPMIQHGSVYDRPAPPAGYRVLIMRKWPRGIRRDSIDLWLKDAAPSRQLLQAYHHGGLPWSEFERQYRDEIRERPDVLDELRELQKERGTVVLLCFERIPPEEHCHRLILLDILQQR